MAQGQENGFCFNFKLPSKDLALRSVAISNGAPVLVFDASLNVPTLTEEDVGIACRLASEGLRPEFYYLALPIDHPFYGRQYKHYSPQWLRGTSIGELLSEADWKMKCLYIGAKSDETKEKFWAWQETSKLQGLATYFDFPEDSPPGSIIMSCDSLEVQKSEEELVFIGEPKMRIDAEGNSTYTKYITETYPSIAFYDEPLFLKMQELIKLVLAAEWLQNKGVEFSPSWMQQCSNPQHKSKPIAVKVKDLSDNEVKLIMNIIEKHFPDTKHYQQLGSLSLDTTVEKHIDKSSIEVKISAKMKCSFPFVPEVERTTIVRASQNNYNMLYKGMDPNMPLARKGRGKDDSELNKPNVNSWEELFSETVPWPRTWALPYNKGEGIATASGGVTTTNIPERGSVASKTQMPVSESVSQDQYIKYSNGSIGVKAKTAMGGGKERTKKIPTHMVPQPREVVRPDSNVTSETNQTLVNQSFSKETKRAYGWEDPCSRERVVYDEQGRLIGKQSGYRQYFEHGVTINGQPTSNDIPPTLQPLPLGEELTPQQVAQPAGATNDLLSPTSSVFSSDSGYSTFSESNAGD